MPATYLLPVITTKEQIGLSNVTNDTQLKKTSNLEDIDNAALARTNLGLGTSASKDVGTGSDDVAAGDHDHHGVYAPILTEDENYVTDAEKTKLSNLSGVNTGDQDLSNYSQITHTHNEDDLTDLDKYSQSEIDLILQRLKGISLTQNDLLYMYNHNTKLIATCEADEAWTNGSWDGVLSGATHGDNTTNYKVGSQGISVTTTSTSTAAIYLDFTDKDLTKFEDGSASDTSDYIEICVYCANTSKVTQGFVLLPTDTLGTKTNYYYYTFYTLLSNGWNHLKIQKSAFTATGSPDWSLVKGIEFVIRSSDGTSVSYTIDAIRMTRADSVGTLYPVSPGQVAGTTGPNPFQIENDGVMERVFEISSGTPFLGYDGTTLVVKGVQAVLLNGTYFTGNEILLTASGIPNATNMLNIGIQDTSFGQVGLYSNTIILYNGATNYVQANFAFTAGDEINLECIIRGESMYGRASKSGLIASKVHVITRTTTETVRLYIYENASLTSFKCSSSPLMVNS